LNVIIFNYGYVTFSIGYSNEVGEAFRAQVPVNFVRLTYGMAFLYVLADTRHKTLKVKSPVRSSSLLFEACCFLWKILLFFLELRTNGSDSSFFVQELKKKMVAASDVLIWQTLASVAIPGFTINRVCFFSLALLARTTKLGLQARKWTTTAIGLGCIPFIVHPIDRFVDYFMDKTFRVAFPPEEQWWQVKFRKTRYNLTFLALNSRDSLLIRDNFDYKQFICSN